MRDVGQCMLRLWTTHHRWMLASDDPSLYSKRKSRVKFRRVNTLLAAWTEVWRNDRRVILAFRLLFSLIAHHKHCVPNQTSEV